MKIISNLCKVLILGTLLFMCACDDDDNNNVIVPPTETIAQFITNNDDYSTLKAALDLTELTSTLNGEEEFTVFAPKNTAFDTYFLEAGIASIDDIDTPEEIADLKTLLLNHVVSGTNRTSSLNTGYINSLSAFNENTDEFLSMYLEVSNGIVAINGGAVGDTNGATVTEEDLPMSNGIVHIVDAIIQLPTIDTFVIIDPNLSSLLAAISAYPSFEYTTQLAGDGPFTLFAPDNNAFDLLFEGDELPNQISDITEEDLSGILNLHVVDGSNIRVEAFTEDPLTTSGGTLTVDPASNILSDGSDPVIESTILSTNIQASNGVLHIIDNVLLTSTL